MELISVVIPFYNDKLFLPALLDSLQHQTYNNFEAIFIDDGSTDDGSGLVRKYIDSDNRFTLLKQSNRGQAIARGTGVRKARGKFVTFIDGDDFVGETHLETLYRELIKNSADLSMVNAMKVTEQGKEIGVQVNGLCSNVYFGNDIIVNWLNGKVPGFLWNKLFFTKTLENINFNDSKNFMEDVRLINTLITNISSLAYTNETTYFYRQRENSAVNKTVTMDEWVAMHETLCAMEKIATTRKEIDAWKYRVVVSYSFMLRHTSILFFSKYQGELKQIMQSHKVSCISNGRLRDRLVLLFANNRFAFRIMKNLSSRFSVIKLKRK